MKVVFMGTPDFAEKSLEALYNAGHEIVGVVTNPDKPKGRGMKMIASPVKEFAIEKKLNVYQPEKIKGNVDFIEEIKDLNPDVICVVAYGKILPKELLNIPPMGCINVHGSLLPKYRGAAPIQWAVLNGDKTTGVTTMYMDVGMDTGDMILKEEVEIGKDETTGELWDRLAAIGAKLLVKTLQEIKEGTAQRIKQTGNYSMAPMLDKNMARINWENQSSEQIKNQIRGLNPIMGAYSLIDEKKYKFWKSQIVSNQEFCNMFEMNIDEIIDKPSGTILISDCKKGLYVKCSDAIIKILEIQGENAKKMPIEDFLRGNMLEIGKKFG